MVVLWILRTYRYKKLHHWTPNNVKDVVEQLTEKHDMYWALGDKFEDHLWPWNNECKDTQHIEEVMHDSGVLSVILERNAKLFPWCHYKNSTTDTNTQLVTRIML